MKLINKILNFEEEEFLRNNFKVLDKNILINKLNRLNAETRELEEFKITLINKIKNLSDKDLEEIFNEL